MMGLASVFRGERRLDRREAYSLSGLGRNQIEPGDSRQRPLKVGGRGLLLFAIREQQTEVTA